MYISHVEIWATCARILHNVMLSCRVVRSLTKASYGHRWHWDILRWHIFQECLGMSWMPWSLGPPDTLPFCGRVTRGLEWQQTLYERWVRLSSLCLLILYFATHFPIIFHTFPLQVVDTCDLQGICCTSWQSYCIYTLEISRINQVASQDIPSRNMKLPFNSWYSNSCDLCCQPFPIDLFSHVADQFQFWRPQPFKWDHGRTKTMHIVTKAIKAFQNPLHKNLPDYVVGKCRHF